MLETKCPVCGKKDSLEYSQNADIVYRIVEGRLIPQLDENSIGWLDSTYLGCKNCGVDDWSSSEIAVIKHDYDNSI